MPLKDVRDGNSIIAPKDGPCALHRYIYWNIATRRAAEGSRMEISVRELTTCGAAPDGGTIAVDCIDSSGEPVSIRLPFDLAGALAMTLPQLISSVVKARSGSDKARYVFRLGRWSIESTLDFLCLIVTLRTEDGFEAAFAVDLETSRSFARALTRSEQRARAAAGNLAEAVSATDHPDGLRDVVTDGKLIQ